MASVTYMEITLFLPDGKIINFHGAPEIITPFILLINDLNPNGNINFIPKLPNDSKPEIFVWDGSNYMFERMNKLDTWRVSIIE